MKFKKLSTLFVLFVALVSCTTKDYQAVENDPIKTRIYTLDNGLKVFMSVNKEEPRIQTYIAVRVGAKNDPAETTGLAHYFEHLMFKGTKKFGTSNYETEKPLLDEIEQLFEIYRKTTDEKERKEIYKKIDSISYEASKISIPNEYDKLMSAIGATGTNAYTNYDVTCYVENIPSNEIENWAKIQADRFQNCVIRGFHTELEAVYEEYNMSLTSDSRKIWQTINSALFKNHPYGTQTVLGTQEHLKNPSITNIKKYHDIWYVPNNMAICLSGDFDPDNMIQIIKKYFGEMKPNKNLPKLEFKPEEPITKPVVSEVVGLEAESTTLAWRLGSASSADADLAELTADILYNGKAGLFDLDLLQKQKVLSAFLFANMMPDYGMIFAQARPKEGQTLEELRDFILGEIAKLRAGDFDISLLKASIANKKLQIMQYLDDNEGRADAYVSAFVDGIDWANEVKKIERWGKITKADIVKFANEKLGDNDYAIVYKRKGTPEDKKISKPEITPIFINRDEKSDFLAKIQLDTVKPIEPVFLDFSKDIKKTTTKSDVELIYKKNETTDLFKLYYVFETGSNNDATLGIAFDYLNFLGTETKSPEEIKKEFYDIACTFNTTVLDNKSYVTVGGLGENMPKAMQLMEELLEQPKGDENVLENMKKDILKSRADAKLNQRSNFSALGKYAMYGEKYIKTNTLNNEAVEKLTSDELLAKVKNMTKSKHTILYYGPNEIGNVAKNIDEYHNVPEKFEPIEKIESVKQETLENKVLFAEYDAKQIYYLQYSNRGEKFDVANDADVMMYNSYFGSGMNSVVFQEMREARGLAYSAWAMLSNGETVTQPYIYRAFIATQNDKMTQAIDAFDKIINNMPKSQAAFDIAKESIISVLRTQRKIKDDVLWAYLNAKELGVDYDRDKMIYEKIQNMKLADIEAFQEKWIKNRKYTYCVLGDSKNLDLNKLRKLGEIKFLTKEQIFGY